MILEIIPEVRRGGLPAAPEAEKIKKKRLSSTELPNLLFLLVELNGIEPSAS